MAAAKKLADLASKGNLQSLRDRLKVLLGAIYDAYGEAKPKEAKKEM